MAEKPIECNNCQKVADIIYKEITNDKITCTRMCTQCPILSKKLHGKPNNYSMDVASEKKSELTCSFCMTTAEGIQTGEPLGCYLCYGVFKDLLIENLLEENKLPSNIQQEIKMSKNALIHKGKLPRQSISIHLSNEITTLTSALNEALQKEHYEHAAWLRDQIKELKGREIDQQK